MNENIIPSKKIHTINDARNLAKKRLPKLIFDFIDGLLQETGKTGFITWDRRFTLQRPAGVL